MLALLWWHQEMRQQGRWQMDSSRIDTSDDVCAATPLQARTCAVWDGMEPAERAFAQHVVAVTTARGEPLGHLPWGTICRVCRLRSNGRLSEAGAAAYLMLRERVGGLSQVVADADDHFPPPPLLPGCPFLG